MKKLLPIITLLLFLNNTSGQENYGLKSPNYQDFNKIEVCGRLSTIFNNKSKEISFGINEGLNHKLYFRFNNKEWFQSLFKNVKDGIAIDIITKDQYDCDIAVLPIEIKGETLKPVYKNLLVKNIETVQEGLYQVFVGNLPTKFHNKEVEFNMLLINNGYLCRNQSTYNIQSYNFDLLDMGLYLDSVSNYNNSQDIEQQEGVIKKYKQLKFKIPFKKNQTSFSVADIKPLYDSLKITDFNIKRIDIKAYSSIEGSAQRNNQLQNQRANSIIKALQTFQKPSIKTIIEPSENWVEFLNDIKGTEYDYLSTLSKSEIKNKLANGLSVPLENKLQNHRKALITLYLEKIDSYQNISEKTLVDKFNQAISDENLSEAESIQNSLFERLKSKNANPDNLYNLKIPKQKKFLDILNANTIYRYQLSQSNFLNAYYDFQELNKLIPNNKKILYNLIVFKLKMSHNFGSILEEKNLLDNINTLKTLGISSILVKRMLVNYHIIKAQIHMKKNEYDEKDISVQFILNTYKNLSLSDNDYLSLAQFLTYYYDRYSAIELLQDKVNKIEVNKRLLFYYLNLTLIEEQLTQDLDYRTIMLNAINIDKKRYCKLFDSSEKGGVTFQLLNNSYLRATYCENCE